MYSIHTVVGRLSFAYAYASTKYKQALFLPLPAVLAVENLLTNLDPLLNTPAILLVECNSSK